MTRALSTTTHPSPALHRRLVAVVLAVLLSLLIAAAGPSTPASADDPPTLPVPSVPDRLGVSGYDLETDAVADVVAGSTGNNLLLRFDAGGPLTDGTVVLTLPRPAWRSPLRVGYTLGLDDPTLAGSVVVRPNEQFGELGPDDCRGTSGPPTVTVLNTAKAQIAVVTHLTCRPGQSVTLRVFDVQAPKSVGRYVLPVSVSDASGQRKPSQVALRVVRKPTTSLRVDVPATVHIAAPTPVLVRAVRRDGRLDTAYRGTVLLRAVDRPDCTFDLREPVTFTAADGGVKVLSFSVSTQQSHRIDVSDVNHRANAASSDPYEVVGELVPVTCSVSYH
ncbi:hypothetical protein SAMN04488544_1977 [Microlunatus sagamiharensis]|uniref:Uncharacterized protein n=1 Tax=Microlunatus sagamiharensis TaxID=546874 RepID=A0A1H2MFJ3_9ACTN|nr:hypothetical protein [Microlunatus sagamiharensis]SDU91980.1 hypothetical protein SAMN04488544_1977 [Microlunatus sagamiharensis]